MPDGAVLNLIELHGIPVFDQDDEMVLPATVIERTAMNNIVFASTKSGREARAVTFPENGVCLLRAEPEFMTHEDTYLKKIAGAAALLVARLDRVSLPGGTAVAAFALAGLIEGMSEDMLNEVMRVFKSS
jgi:hypothetical protein